MLFFHNTNAPVTFSNVAMSLASKLTLAASCLTSAGIIIYVHSKQQHDMDQLHLGVEKDLERQRRRKIENTYILQQQAEFAKEKQKEFTDSKLSAASVIPS